MYCWVVVLGVVGFVRGACKLEAGGFEESGWDYKLLGIKVWVFMLRRAASFGFMVEVSVVVGGFLLSWWGFSSFPGAWGSFLELVFSVVEVLLGYWC